MSSVRAALDPLNIALKRPPNYWAMASFVGLPIINQKLAALHPLGGGAFFVTLQGLMQVVQSTPSNDVIAALARANQPTPQNPSVPKPGSSNPPPAAVQPTIGFQFDGSDPGDSAANDYTIAGGGFVANEKVDIIDSLSATNVATVLANALGQYGVVLAFNTGTSLRLSARGESSGRVSGSISFVA